jgi:predicted 3-demethylubiquinone-9 3-methyltransferase (glyoxalase superfamily)
MQQKIVPNLWFDTEAEEAAQFYVDVFDSPRCAGRPTPHSRAESDGRLKAIV